VLGLEQAHRSTRRHNFHWLAPMGSYRSNLTADGIIQVS
jgi:hypothetical protein